MYIQSCAFSSSYVWMWELDHRESWAPKMLLNCGVGEKILESPLTARISNQPILKEISPEYSLEGLILKLKLWPPDLKNWPSEKTLMLGKMEDRRRRGGQDDEMAEWHHRLDACEFKQALGVGDGQGSLVCCSPWGHKELYMTEQLNWTELL